MQRLLSIATIGLIAGSGYMFLSEPPPGQAPQGQAPMPAGYTTSAPGTSPWGSAIPPVQAPATQNWTTPAAPVGRPTMLLASYNIQDFGKSKEQNIPVLQTLAAVMRNFDLIAVQEISTQDDNLLRRFLTHYLNPASGRVYDFVLGPPLGRSHNKEQYAFIYDTARIEVNPHHIYTVRDPHDLLHREPLVAMFRTRGPSPQEAFTFILVNIHVDPDVAAAEVDDLAKVYHAVRSAAGGEDDIIILGDLNVDSRRLGELARIPGMRPLIASVYTNTRQTEQYDHILIHNPSTTEYAGRSGVFDTTRQFNLKQDQSLQVSDHFPVWAEFSIFESAAPGRVALRSGP